MDPEEHAHDRIRLTKRGLLHNLISLRGGIDLLRRALDHNTEAITQLQERVSLLEKGETLSQTPEEVDGPTPDSWAYKELQRIKEALGCASVHGILQSIARYKALAETRGKSLDTLAGFLAEARIVTGAHDFDDILETIRQWKTEKENPQT